MKNISRYYENRKRQWSDDEILYIIYKNSGVILLGKEAEFANRFKDETIEASGMTREEFVELLIEANQIMLQHIENLYENGITVKEVLEKEATERDITISELLEPYFIV